MTISNNIIVASRQVSVSVAQIGQLPSRKLGYFPVKGLYSLMDSW